MLPGTFTSVLCPLLIPPLTATLQLLFAVFAVGLVYNKDPQRTKVLRGPGGQVPGQNNLRGLSRCDQNVQVSGYGDPLLQFDNPGRKLWLF
jgi:hypothetical protein